VGAEMDDRRAGVNGVLPNNPDESFRPRGADPVPRAFVSGDFSYLPNFRWSLAECHRKAQTVSRQLPAPWT